MMPSENQRPIMHATDVKFVECKGRNVLCVEPYIDLQRNFDVTFGQSDNISTFMSVSQKFSFFLEAAVWHFRNV